MENNLDSKYDLVIGSIADSKVSEIASHIQNKDVAIEMYQCMMFLQKMEEH